MKQHLTLVIVAGLAASVWAQPDTKPTTPPRQPTNTTPAATYTTRAGDYRSCQWLKGRNIINSANDTIGEVTDLLVERGSGTIEYAAVKTGTILGMGGRTIAVPFDSLGWDISKEKFTMAATEDQLKTYPKWSEEDWGGLVASKMPADRPREVKPNEPRNFDDYYYSNREAHPQTWDPYGPKLDMTKPTKIDGEVTSVDRTRLPEHGEQVVVTVKTTAGESKKVALGPSWYINGAKVSPQRGDKISVDAVQAPGGVNGEPIMVASTVHLNNQDYKLRGSTGPAWSQRYYESGEHSYAEPYYRFVLLSKVRGAKLDCNGTDCGKVDDAIVDISGGRVAFLSIDPNENFLGIGDTKRLVPWTVATISLDGTVRLDATKDMILASPQTPSDLKTLNADMIYKSYQVPQPTWEDRRYHSKREADATPTNPR